MRQKPMFELGASESCPRHGPPNNGFGDDPGLMPGFRGHLQTFVGLILPSYHWAKHQWTKFQDNHDESWIIQVAMSC